LMMQNRVTPEQHERPLDEAAFAAMALVAAVLSRS